MTSEIDQKKAFNKLKHDLENWRELILMTNSVLKWEKPYHAGLIFGSITTIFMFLWYLDYSTLTMMCLLCLSAILFDYLYPIISKFLIKPECWTGAHESKFDEICNQLWCLKRRLLSYYDALFTTKDQKSAVFIIGVSIALCFGAYIGCVIDNLLLSYLIVVSLAMYPGVNKTGLISNLKNQLKSKIIKQNDNFDKRGTNE